MKTIRERIEINAPPLEVFDFAQRFINRKTWDPFLTGLTEATKDKWREDGVLELMTGSKPVIECEYLKYDRPRHVTIKMINGPHFLKGFTGTWRFMYIDRERTAVVFLYNFELAAGWSWLQAGLEAYFRWDMGRRLHALKNELEQEVDLLDALEKQFAA